MSETNRNNVHDLGAFDPETLFQSLRDMRATMIGAWRERAVLLTREEREGLRREIRETGELLLMLTHSSSDDAPLK